jgi:hypothetical protein
LTIHPVSTFFTFLILFTFHFSPKSSSLVDALEPRMGGKPTCPRCTIVQESCLQFDSLLHHFTVIHSTKRQRVVSRLIRLTTTPCPSFLLARRFDKRLVKLTQLFEERTFRTQSLCTRRASCPFRSSTSPWCSGTLLSIVTVTARDIERLARLRNRSLKATKHQIIYC